MSNETTRRSFFSAMAFSPLALLGLRKPESKQETDSDIHRRWCVLLADSLESEKKHAWHLKERTLAAEKDADHLRYRLLTADKDTDLWRELCDKSSERALAAEKDAEEIRDELKELRKETA